jgi:uncharacterized protein (TIGR02246 family)
MKICLADALIGLAISFAVPTFAQQTDTVDPKIAQQIRALASKYDEGFNRNDAAAVAALYTEGAVFTTPNGTLNGRQAIEGLYRRLYFDLYHSKNNVTVVDEILRLGTRYV